jgi:S1-C subfamily serine protease
MAVGLVAGLWWAEHHAGEPLWHAPAASADHAPPAAEPRLPSFRDVVRKVGPAVVTVRARREGIIEDEGELAEHDYTQVADVADERAPGQLEPASEPAARTPSGWRNGSGFVVNEQGLVLTSRHVVDGALFVEVLVPQHGVRRADVVGEDRATDLALLRLIDAPPGMQALALGPSEELEAGDWIVTVGNPFGFARTVTAGVVSFVGRHLSHTDLEVTSGFLQISAPVNPGSSGCPVVDVDGRVVGMTTQVAVAAQGISFAVPSRTMKWALDAMNQQSDGRVRRGYLGIEFASRPGVDERGEPREGAVIVRVANGEAADRAGVKKGDVVLRVDGRPVRDAKELHERIVCRVPGAQLALQLLRDGQIQDPIVAVLGEVGRKAPVETPN